MATVAAQNSIQNRKVHVIFAELYLFILLQMQIQNHSIFWFVFAVEMFLSVPFRNNIYFWIVILCTILSGKGWCKLPVICRIPVSPFHIHPELSGKPNRWLLLNLHLKSQMAPRSLIKTTFKENKSDYNDLCPRSFCRPGHVNCWAPRDIFNAYFIKFIFLSMCQVFLWSIEEAVLFLLIPVGLVRFLVEDL